MKRDVENEENDGFEEYRKKLLQQQQRACVCVEKKH